MPIRERLSQYLNSHLVWSTFISRLRKDIRIHYRAMPPPRSHRDPSMAHFHYHPETNALVETNPNAIPHHPPHPSRIPPNHTAKKDPATQDRSHPNRSGPVPEQPHRRNNLPIPRNTGPANLTQKGITPGRPWRNTSNAKGPITTTPHKYRRVHRRFHTPACLQQP